MSRGAHGLASTQRTARSPLVLLQAPHGQPGNPLRLGIQTRPVSRGSDTLSFGSFQESPAKPSELSCQLNSKVEPISKPVDASGHADTLGSAAASSLLAKDIKPMNGILLDKYQEDVHRADVRYPGEDNPALQLRQSQGGDASLRNVSHSKSQAEDRIQELSNFVLSTDS